jgi:hypothetical protein
MHLTGLSLYSRSRLAWAAILFVPFFVFYLLVMGLMLLGAEPFATNLWRRLWA